MTTKYDGGPAFARTCDEAFQDGQTGMSLRDYFAGQVMAGAVLGNAKSTAYYAYKLADMMLEQRDVAALIAKEGDDE